jgi:hypothetical protein
MYYKVLFTFAFTSMIFVSSVNAQDDLMAMMEKDEKPAIDYTAATFKTTRIVIGQSIELPPKGNMLFLITHHFGAINTGYENLFGLKQASIRLGLEYGLTNWLGFGAGLNTDRNTWDSESQSTAPEQGGQANSDYNRSFCQYGHLYHQMGKPRPDKLFLITHYVCLPGYDRT